MKTTLEELAAQLPEHEAEPMAPAIKTAIERQEELTEAAEQMQRALKQLEAGDAPQLILLTAFKSMALFAADPEYYNKAAAIINNVFPEELAQQSLFADRAAEQAQLIEAQQAEFNQKLKKQLQTQLNKSQRIQRGINELIRELDEESPEK